MKKGFENGSLAQQVLEFRCPRWAQLPDIALYMDQVTGYINDIFRPLFTNEREPLLTKAMVNNYVKLRVIQPPVNKKYSREHLAYLIAICALKQVFSIPEIAMLIQSQIEICSVERAYDYFCDQLEGALVEAFGGASADLPENDSQRLVLRAAQSWADKIYIQKRLEFEVLERESDQPKKK